MRARFRDICACVAVVASSAYSAEPVVHRDLAYAEGKDADARANGLDLYLPSEAKSCPIVVWIHGGGWRRGDKRLVGMKSEALCQRGLALASINYRLHPAADFKSQGQDIAAAVRWLTIHAKEYGGDPDRIVLMGHSAGAHLAALVACDPQYLRGAGVDASCIKGVILLDGAGYDIPRQMEIAAMPRLRELYREIFGEDPATWRAASPIHHVVEGQRFPPFLVLYVAHRPDSRGQSTALVEKLQTLGGRAETIGYEDKTHGTINREFGGADDPPTEAAMKFLSEVVGR